MSIPSRVVNLTSLTVSVKTPRKGKSRWQRWFYPLAYVRFTRLQTGPAVTEIHPAPSVRRVLVTGISGRTIGLSGIPPQALPYLLGSYTMDTARLQRELGPDFEEIVKYSSREALRDALRP